MPDERFKVLAELAVHGANIQPGQPFTASAAGGNFGTLNSTVSNQIGLGTNRQLQLALRLNF